MDIVKELNSEKDNEKAVVVVISWWREMTYIYNVFRTWKRTKKTDSGKDNE